MKNISKISMLTLILVLSGTFCAWAGEVNGLKTFTAGTAAKASEVNGNFNAVKTAVDDNDSAVTANSNSIVTNAGKISSNTDKLTSRAGIQKTSWANIAVTTTANTEITNITVNGSGSLDVSLNAHLVIEINGTGGRYEFTVRRGSANGTVVGTGWWRPGSAAGYQAVTIGFTGFDSGVTGPVKYYLCARKFGNTDPDGTIGQYGLNAEWSKHENRLILLP